MRLWQRLRTIRAQLGTHPGIVRGLAAVARHAHACSARALACRSASRSPSASRRIRWSNECSIPGCPPFAGHAVAARQMKGGFGGMLSVRVKGGEAAAHRDGRTSSCGSARRRSAASKA
jgi:cystathionine gamma-synthase